MAEQRYEAVRAVRDDPDSGRLWIWPRVASSTMGTKAERRQPRERVAAYHEACLGQLVAHVANVLDGYRAGELDAYAVDETIHYYHRAAGDLWKFC